MLYKDRKSKVVISCVTLALPWVTSGGLATMGAARFHAAHLPLWGFIQVCVMGRELLLMNLYPSKERRGGQHRIGDVLTE